MRRALIHALGIALCLAAPLTGCATMPTALASPTPLDRATAAYARVRAAAVTAVPFLPPEIADHVCSSIAIGDEALAAARAQTGSDDQLQAMEKLATAVATIVASVAKR